MRSRVPRGCDSGAAASGQAAPMLLGAGAGAVRTRRRWFAALALALALGGAACGRGDDGAGDEPELLTGRVVSLDADARRYCVSPDRGATRTCIDVPDPKAVEGVDVGECVTTSPDLTSAGSKVVVVDDAACAAGDLGGDAPDE